MGSEREQEYKEEHAMTWITWILIVIVTGFAFFVGNSGGQTTECASGSDECLVANGWQPVTVNGVDGVIVAEDDVEDLVGFATDDMMDSAWTPTLADLEVLESKIDAYAQTVSPPSGQEPPTTLADYKRQYAGYIEDGNRKIFVNSFCDDMGSDWQREPIFVMDGGTCFFTARYDVEKQEFEALYFNGSA
jgi:hypothetical protein